MSTLLFYAIAFTLGCYTLASLMVLVRLLRGPRAQDRVFALDLLYMQAMLVVLVIGIFHQSDLYFEVALLIALFGFVSSAGMAKFILRGEVIE
ncbi:K+/H+ antiporter subunit F [Lysobacter soli]|jgi:multicomponent K+:H+ antiporter subunit F|uniref:K+/H+ antiporter subunit F n=1 Tax=Lysobacter soli TaxID=453783 RepID=A0A3D8VE71_9GAMM|nr:K+/H+ antiporter subunit F [Lysobacter soli]MDG2518015.1 K+/H+ antiporter subunit F [Lysobacter soli]QGW64972.1 K+/H+ antiporter subunit F [Lysobacter soli]RDY67361.1 K+/H+ antiporter subunit F [Lysobacter soli]UTA53283.1 K+/H+ antiporter subunit F [Lysobacter soli]